MANAETVEIDGIYYNLSSESKTAEVTKNPNYYSGDIVIPESVKYEGTTYYVTSIGVGAFSNYRELPPMTIPNSVTSIGNYAFSECSNLTSITIPDGVTSIGEYAFAGCVMTSITIPASVRSIGWKAFYDCDNLEIVNITDIAAWCTINFVCYREEVSEEVVEGDGIGYDSIYIVHADFWFDYSSNPLYYAHHLYLNGTEVKDLVIPEGVTYISSYAFVGYTGLKSITIGKDVSRIGLRAFLDCSNLETMRITDIAAWKKIYFDYTYIYPYAAGGEHYQYLSWAESYSPDYNSNPLYYAHHLYLDDTEINGVSVPQFAKITSITFGNNVKSIGDDAFYGWADLKSVTIGNNVTTIGNSAFGDCWGLTAVHITDLSTWCKIVFSDYGSNPLVYAHHLYLNGTEVKDLVIPNGVTSIGNYTFSECTDLTSITIPNSVTSIGYSAFDACSSLTSVTIPNSVTSIGGLAFHYCAGLTSLTIPNSVTSIGGMAFCECYGITSVIIGNNVTSIGYGAFDWCDNLTSVTVLSVYPFEIDEYAFYSSNITLFVPAGCKKDYEAANYWRDFKEIIELEETLKDGDVFTANIPALNKGERVPMTFKVLSINDKTVQVGNNEHAVPLSVAKEITIPEDIKGMSVKSIGNNAFTDCSGLAKITIPSSVESIGWGAFAGCENLEALNLKDIAAWCKMQFDYDHISESYDHYFEDVDDDWIGYKEYNYSYFGHNYDYSCNPLYYAHHLYLNGTEVKDLVIPEGVTSIGAIAFAGCSGLTSVTIPQSLESIGWEAFSGCTGLNAVHITNVADWCNTSFDYSKVTCSWESVGYHHDIEDEFDHGEEYEFDYSCNPLCYAHHLYLNGTEIKDLVIPNGITTINGGTFINCVNLGSVTIPNSVTSIGESAFSGCSGLKAVKTEGTSPAKVSDVSAFPNRADIILCVLKGNKSSYAVAYCWKDFKMIREINGDVNVDDETDVIDVVDIARFVVGTPSESFVKLLADLNFDYNVNIADAVTLVNMIAGDQNFAKPYRVKPQSESHDVLTLTEKADGSLALNLENQRGYTAFQFDIFLPEGVDITEIALNGSRRQQHQLLYSKVGDGHYKVAALSTSNRTFSGSKGELLGFITDSSIHDGILIDDIHFFTPNGQDYLFDAVSLSGTTEIETVAEDKELQDGEHPSLYDMQGRKILSPVGRKGIYIVNGKKVVIK